jgi:HAD superfamily hydrolase (TIGR01509 family)
LIFDLDGVIVDSNPVHEQVWRQYLRLQGVPADGTMAQRMYGRRNDEIVRDLFGAHLSAEEVLAHGAAKEALYRATMKAHVRERLVPGVREFIRAHVGWPMGLASNAEPANVEFILNEAGLRDYFSVVVDGHQVGRPKPDPEIYLRAAALLGVAPSGCIVFEDSVAGVRSARAAGARVVALTTTHARLPEADLNVRDFLSAELDLWIARQFQRP